MKNLTLRIISLTLCALCLALALCACGGDGGSASTSDYVFVTPDGVTVAIGGDAEDTVDALGKWSTMNSSDSCGGISGKDYIYAYSGYRVSTTPSTKGQIVCKIELTDDSVATPEGVRVGMSVEEAKSAMGGSPETVGENLVYTSKGTKLQIICSGGDVVGIVYVVE